MPQHSMKESPRHRWLQSRVNGRVILDIGFAGQDGNLHRKLSSLNPGSLLIGLDHDSCNVLSLGLPGTLAGDAFALPFASGSIESVVLAEVIEHLHNSERVFQEVSRVLCPSGYLFLTTPNPFALSLWPKFWLFARRPAERSNYREYLAAPDHCIFWEPLSLINILYDYGLVVEEVTTTNLGIPLLGRFWPGARLLDPKIWPFTRLGSYTCLVACRK